MCRPDCSIGLRNFDSSWYTFARSPLDEMIRTKKNRIEFESEFFFHLHRRNALSSDPSRKHCLKWSLQRTHSQRENRKIQRHTRMNYRSKLLVHSPNHLHWNINQLNNLPLGKNVYRHHHHNELWPL